MAQLELKHLSPYLPYGLQMLNTKSGKITTITGAAKDGIDIVVMDNGRNYDLDIWPLTPMLRPLSQFNNNIDGKGTMYEQTYNVANLDLSDGLNLNISFEQQGNYLPLMDCYNTLQVLFANHFDVFNLIEQGLAIPK